MGPRGRKILIAVAVVAVAMQMVPLDRSNPPVQEEIQAPPQVMQILRTSCYDCHSNQTTWPWYSYVAPASYLLVYDVHEGREYLNFSEWNRYDARRRAKKIEEVAEEVAEGKMPLPIYVVAHQGAALTEESRRTLEEWARTMPGGQEGEDRS